MQMTMCNTIWTLATLEDWLLSLSLQNSQMVYKKFCTKMSLVCKWLAFQVWPQSIIGQNVKLHDRVTVYYLHAIMSALNTYVTNR